jgi:hypothetical protein
MLTRGYVVHPYSPVPVEQVNRDGFVRVVRQNNITQTWAVSRPGSSPHPVGAPFYVNEWASPQNVFFYGGAMPLTPVRPRIEMDPSNPATWQREYKFS